MREKKRSKHTKRKRKSKSPSSSSSSYSPERRRKRHSKKQCNENCCSHPSTSENERLCTPTIPVNTSEETVSNLQTILNNLSRVDKDIGVSVRDRDIPDFNPRNDNIDVWLTKIDDYAHIYAWSDRYLCHLVVNKLRGPAETWYRTLNDIPKSWIDFKFLLLETFPPTRDLHQLMTRMLGYKHRTGQNLYEYCFEKLALVRQMNIKLSGRDEVNLIVGGLSNYNLKLSVKAAGIDCPSKLAGYLKPFGNGTENSYSQVKPFVMQDHNQTNPSTSAVCYNCQQPGHKQFNRTTKKTASCKYCHKTGHTVDHCFKLSKNNNPPKYSRNET
ncbi:hypothetical protein QE152_g23596 [Popillia japonica]|uniref:Retrotransposon gag domain-containing protein n=1 Tax=Popillia japonica TaxID=7064 RepID=A0AAW1KGG2_POPJA